MTTGVVTSVSPHNGSGTLTADVAIGATVLPLDDAEPFAEDFTEPRYLVIGAEATPREYVATVNDESSQESVTLAVALDVGFELGMPVTPWDPTAVADDKRGVTHQVWVRPDDQEGAIRATVPHEFIPLSGVEALIGAPVGLGEDAMSGWMVEQVYGREAAVDGSYVIGGSLTVTALQTSEELDEPRVLMNNALGAAVRLYTGDANEGYEESGEIRGYLSGSGGTRQGVLAVEAPIVSDLPTPTSFGSLYLTGESADASIQSSMLATAKFAEFVGEMQINSLADGGSNNLGSGAKYCRVGADGVLFSSTSSPSSRTVKHDIQDLDLDQEALLSLRPVTFRYNDDPDTVRVGFIAEEAHDLGLTALVGYEDRADATNPTGFDYDGMGAALLLVVQRQQERLDIQRDRIKALEDRLDALEG